MKTVILAGGLGTRLSEETELIPKPMIEIGGRPLLWHLMKIFSAQGFNDFTVALGYKGEIIKRYFLQYPQLESDLRLDLASGTVNADGRYMEDWKLNFRSMNFFLKLRRTLYFIRIKQKANSWIRTSFDHL